MSTVKPITVQTQVCDPSTSRVPFTENQNDIVCPNNDWVVKIGRAHV